MNTAWTKTLLAGLRGAGADIAVASPGSRSTPLLCAARDVGIPIHVAIDERTAAFFAVGRAKVTGRPALLLCTSGSAATHYHPAIVEAALSYVPVVAVTADRPPELAACGAAQTIDQTRLFGEFARAFFDLGLPDDTPDAMAGVARKASQAVAVSLGPVPGPVHINVPARKPLEPQPDPANAGLPAGIRSTRHFAPVSIASDDGVAALVQVCRRSERGLVVCGPAPVSAVAARDAVAELAARTGFPMWCEAASQMRFRGRATPPLCCDALDHVADELAPADVIVELWGPPTSAAYHQYLARNPAAQRWVVTPHGWRDPHNTAHGIIHGDIAEAARRIAAGMTPRAATDWTASVCELNRRGQAIGETDADAESRLVRAAVAAIPAGGLVALGNSKPIRTVDRFVAARAVDAAVWSQRGANGIDGLISGGAGAASAGDRPVLLVVGDVSAAHDIGGLALARRATCPLAIVVVDNGGGRIFEQLPIAAAESIAPDFSRLWLTPPGIDFAAAAATYGVDYAATSNYGELTTAVRAALGRPGCTLIRAEVAA